MVGPSQWPDEEVLWIDELNPPHFRDVGTYLCMGIKDLSGRIKTYQPIDKKKKYSKH